MASSRYGIVVREGDWTTIDVCGIHPGLSEPDGQTEGDETTGKDRVIMLARIEGFGEHQGKGR